MDKLAYLFCSEPTQKARKRDLTSTRVAQRAVADTASQAGDWRRKMRDAAGRGQVPPIELSAKIRVRVEVDRKVEKGDVCVT